MDTLTTKELPDRSKINLQDAREAKGWAHKLGISQDELRALIEKVGNSAAVVKKELQDRNPLPEGNPGMGKRSLR